MSKQTDILIVGGGMAGLSMAVALARLSLDVVVVDKASLKQQQLPGFDGRVSAISLGSKRMLAKLGVWEAMAPHAEPILDIRVSDGQSPSFLHYDHEEVKPSSNSQEVEQNNGEPFGWIVENRYTSKALYDAALALGNISFHQASVSWVGEQAEFCTIGLDDNTEIKAKFVIGADGKFSKIRELAGIQQHEVDYKQTAIVCTIEHELPHHGLAQERFLARGPFAVLPMKNNHSSLVWVEPEAIAKYYLELDKEDAEQEITERIGDYLGKISVKGKLFAYPLKLTLSEAFTSGRIALIGDAAHAIHPIAGQGINLGFRDVAALAELIETQHNLGLDIASSTVMDGYAKWRRMDTVTMAAVTDGLNRLFSTSFLPIKLARGAGLFAVSKCPPLKRVFMKHAMGISGDLPKLMQNG